LTIAITVSGGSGNPTPTGSATLISGSYSSSATTLAGGSASIVIPAGTLPIGSDTLTAIYTPDSASSAEFNNTSGSTSVYITQTVPIAPTVQVLPLSSNLTTADSLSVMVIVGATGTVIITSGNYTSAATTLVNDIATIVIPGGTLPVGTDTLLATYTPDAASSFDYLSAVGSAVVTVSAPPPPAFTVAGGASVSVMPGAATGNTSTITVTPTGGFTGSVALTATLTNSPAGAQYPPTLSFGSTSPVNISGANAGTATLIITTTAPSSAALDPSRRPGAPWVAAGGATLACILLFALPKRRRWRSILGTLALLAAFGSVVSCNSSAGGSGGGGGGGGGNSGTTAGTYTITVTGVSGTMTATNTLTLVVQ
jgi:hypothetical protein